MKYSFFASRRGSANMWWIIIGAVIALVVMIILMVMFVGKTRPLEAGLSECEGKGGICFGKGTTACPAGMMKSSAFDCSDEGECCIGFPKKHPKECSDPDLEPIIDPQGEKYCQ